MTTHPDRYAQEDTLPPWVRSVLTELGILRAEINKLTAVLEGRQKPYITVREAAAKAGRSEYTLRRWVAEKKIVATKVGATGPHGRLLIDRASLERLLHGPDPPVPETDG